MVWQRCCGEEAIEAKDGKGENETIINNATSTPKVTTATVTLRSHGAHSVKGK